MNKIYAWITNAFWAEKDRFILWVPVFLGAGVALYFSLNNEPASGTGITLLSFCVIGCLIGRKSIGCCFVMTALGLMALGLTLAQMRTENIDAPVLAKKTNAVYVTGWLKDIDRLENANRITLENLKLERTSVKDTPQYVRIRLPGKFELPNIGDKIKIRAVLNPPSPPVAPGAFDFQRYAYFRQLGGTGYAVGHVEILEPATHTGYKLILEKWRQIISDRIEKVMKPDTAAVATALLTGERNGISDEWWEKIRTSGIAHLLAISGLHIGLVAGFAFFIIRACLAAIEVVALRYPVKKISAIGAFICALFYMLLVGAPVSSQRALLMTGIVLFAIVLDREAFSLRLAAFAAIIVLLIAPESLLGASFQLSFSAVISLIAFYEATRHFWKRFYNKSMITRAMVYLSASLMTTIISSLATAPYALFHFQRLDFIPGLLANMVAVPVTVFLVMPTGLLALLMTPLGLEGGLLQIMEYGVGWILQVVHYASSIPYGVWELPVLSTAFVFWMTFGGLWLALWQGKVRYLGFIGIILGVLTSAVPQPDILISGDAKIMAIRLPDGNLSVSTKRSERFIRKNWQRRNGQGEASDNVTTWPKQGILAEGILRCDPLACLYRVDNRLVSLIRNPLALAEDCENVDMIISPIPVQNKACQAKYIIDRFDLWSGGAHAVFFDNGSIKIETVFQKGKSRPWYQN